MMLKSILQISRVKKLQKNEQKLIIAGGGETPETPCSEFNPCLGNYTCCSGVCFDLSTVLEMPHGCSQLES